MIVLISVVVLAVAIVIAGVGYYLGAYRPAHQALLTVGNERLTASEIEARTVYLLMYQPTIAPREAADLIPKALDLLEREAILRQRAPALVGEVSSDELAKDLGVRLATATPQAPTSATPTIVVSTPTSTPTSTAAATPTGTAAAASATSTATATATPVPGPTPFADPKQVAETQQERLLKSGLSKQAFDALSRAQILEDRLSERFRKEAPQTTLQWEVQVAGVATQERADQLREIAARPGVDFARVASAGGSDRANGQLAWILPELQEPAIRDVLAKLKAGEISPSIKSGARFLVYRLVQIDERRDVSEDQRDDIAKDLLTKWYDEARTQLTIQREVASNRENAMRANVISAYQKVNPPVKRAG